MTTHHPGGESKRRVILIVRISLALFATLASGALAWTLLGSHTAGRAASTFNEYPTQLQPWGIVLDNAHGNVWVAEPNCNASPVCSGTVTPGAIGRYKMATPSLNPKMFAPPATYNPVFLRLDKTGNIWFTDPTHNAIGKLNPVTNAWTEWTVPTVNAAPYDLTFDKNGNLWFTEILGNSVGFFIPSTQTFVETKTPSANSSPYGIAKDALGNIWIAENGLSKIAMFKPTVTGTGIIIKEFPIETGTTPTPHLITTDSAGKIWYSEGFSGNVGKYDPVLKTHTDYPVSAGLTQTHISGIGVDSTGQVWFTDSLAARIGTLNPTTGTVTIIQIGFAGAHPHDGLVVDASNNVWITELYGYRLGEVLASSTPTPSPTASATV
jgi:virginiamycin B lyase